MHETTASRSLPDIPETDDPVMLRELLRQAHEHLRMRESIEQMLAENAARTERLLVDARAAHEAASAVDPAELRTAVDSARSSLQAALAAVDRLGALVPVDAAPVAAAASSPAETERETDGPRTVEVLVQDVTSPAVARSLQQFLAGLSQVSRAEVRELAEGLLRITVETSAPLTGQTLAAWEPERDRTIRTERANVLEIELGG